MQKPVVKLFQNHKGKNKQLTFLPIKLFAQYFKEKRKDEIELNPLRSMHL